MILVFIFYIFIINILMISYIYITMEKGQNWSSEENIISCCIYMVISKDHEISTFQTRSILWKKVAIECNQKTNGERDLSNYRSP
jgi:hypothetical protein